MDEKIEKKLEEIFGTVDTEVNEIDDERFHILNDYNNKIIACLFCLSAKGSMSMSMLDAITDEDPMQFGGFLWLADQIGLIDIDMARGIVSLNDNFSFGEMENRVTRNACDSLTNNLLDDDAEKELVKELIKILDL